MQAINGENQAKDPSVYPKLSIGAQETSMVVSTHYYRLMYHLSPALTPTDGSQKQAPSKDHRNQGLRAQPPATTGGQNRNKSRGRVGGHCRATEVSGSILIRADGAGVPATKIPCGMVLLSPMTTLPGTIMAFSRKTTLSGYPEISARRQKDERWGRRQPRMLGQMR